MVVVLPTVVVVVVVVTVVVVAAVVGSSVDASTMQKTKALSSTELSGLQFLDPAIKLSPSDLMPVSVAHA